MDRTTVFNLAVSYYGEEPRDEWGNSDKIARLCDLYYSKAEENVRREHAWSFLTEEMPIIADSGKRRVGEVEYSESYALPSWVVSVESVTPATQFVVEQGNIYTVAHIDSFSCTTNDYRVRQLYTFENLGKRGEYDYCYRLPSIVGRIVRVMNEKAEYRLVSSSILSKKPVQSFLYIDNNATSDNVVYEQMVANKLAQMLLPSQGADRNIASLLNVEYARLKEELVRSDITSKREINNG